MRTDLYKSRGSFPIAPITNCALSPKCDLISLSKKIKNEDAWKNGGLVAKILLINPSQSIVLVALHPGTEVESFQENISVAVQVLGGRLKFLTNKKTVVLEKGQSFALYENLKYSLIAKVESVFLLTITTGNFQSAELM